MTRVPDIPSGSDTTADAVMGNSKIVNRNSLDNRELKLPVTQHDEEQHTSSDTSINPTVAGNRDVTAVPTAVDYPFAVWAPFCEQVKVVVDEETYPMIPGDNGWWGKIAPITATTRYGFQLDDDPLIYPDPRSPRQPDGVHGLSQTFSINPQFWTDTSWTGRPLGGSVIYELHVGTFTPEGTFEAAILKLDYLANIGIDFIELMPVNSFNGSHGWGYDGVAWFSVHEPYGGPEGLAKFVNAAHEYGIGVILDVVYNHLGPSGNYLDKFGPYTVPDGNNPWGSEVNLSGEYSDQVREYIFENALRWLGEFHIDGLRIDAIHALNDNKAVHLIEDLRQRLDTLSASVRRTLILIGESELNDPTFITSRDGGGYGLDAQWNDDFHHAIHAAVTGEQQGCYADFGSIEVLATVLRQGFYYIGNYSSFRKKSYGQAFDITKIPGSRLIGFTSNHDQVGNRATGDRPSQYLTQGQLAVQAALVLLSSFTPMLFMGEEWGASTPFQYFSSHQEPELARAIRKARKKEFAEYGWDTKKIPDPQHIKTFQNSKLQWEEIYDPDHTQLLEAYIALIRFRKSCWQFTDPWLNNVLVGYNEEDKWLAMQRHNYFALFNLNENAVTIPFIGTPVLAWGTPEVQENGTVLPAHSFTVLQR